MGQILINVSINELSGENDNKSSSSLQMAPHHGGPINTLEGRTVIQKDFSNLQKWPERNVM